MRQGCPLFPLLFALTTEPYLFEVGNHPSVLGLQTSGTGKFKVAAYADDVTIYITEMKSALPLSSRYLQFMQSSTGPTSHKCKSQSTHLIVSTPTRHHSRKYFWNRL